MSTPNGKRNAAAERVSLAHVLATLGGPAKVGAMAGCTGQAVSQWAEVIPELRARRLAEHPDCPFSFDQLPVRAT